MNNVMEINDNDKPIIWSKDWCIENKLYFEHLPEKINISTITMTCKLNIENKEIKNLYNYEVVKKYFVKPDKKLNMETDEWCEKKKKKKRTNVIKNEKKFGNQFTITIMVDNSNISIKFFKNGSLHFTGCKNLQYQAPKVLKYIFKKFKTPIVGNNNEIEKFTEYPEIFKINNIIDFKVSAINSVYSSGIKIDSNKLRNLLTEKNMRVELDKNVHAGVNLKINQNNHDITIIIFESGKIMINSSRNCLEILDVCQFINDFIIDNYDICI